MSVSDAAAAYCVSGLLCKRSCSSKPQWRGRVACEPHFGLVTQPNRPHPRASLPSSLRPILDLLLARHRRGIPCDSLGIVPNSDFWRSSLSRCRRNCRLGTRMRTLWMRTPPAMAIVRRRRSRPALSQAPMIASRHVQFAGPWPLSAPLCCKSRRASAF